MTEWNIDSDEGADVDGEHLYVSDGNTVMRYDNGSDGNAVERRRVAVRRAGAGPPDGWATSIAIGRDPDDPGQLVMFFADTDKTRTRIYKRPAGRRVVTDAIAQGQLRELPRHGPEGKRLSWEGIAADPQRPVLWGIRRYGDPGLFRMDLRDGRCDFWTEGDGRLNPNHDQVLEHGTLMQDVHLRRDDADGAAYFGVVDSRDNGMYLYRLDPNTGRTERQLRIRGPAAQNRSNSYYGLAHHNGHTYLSHVSGALYRIEQDGWSTQVHGGDPTRPQGRDDSRCGPTRPPGTGPTDLASGGTRGKTEPHEDGKKQCQGTGTTTTGGGPTEPPIKGMNNILEALLGTLVQALMAIGGCRLGNILAQILDALANILSALGSGRCQCDKKCQGDKKCQCQTTCHGDHRECQQGGEHKCAEGRGG